MIKKRSAKYTFIASIVSMALCLTMLIGTSLAWFTDSATNEDNIIAIGTLGVELRMGMDITNEDGTTSYGYVNVSDEDNADSKKYIFSEASDGKWEPGKTEVVFLQVANVADLALNYNIILEVAAQNLSGGEKADISQVMQYAIIPGVDKTAFDEKYNAKKESAENPLEGWNAIAAIAQEIQNAYNDGKPGADQTTLVDNITEGFMLAAPKGALEKEESDYFALAVHMTPDAGNEFQNHEIKVDVKVEAKQMVSESDYFDSTYDEAAGNQ